MDIAMITSGYMPVPAAMGGGVEALIDNLIRKNEQYGMLQLTVFSIDHPQAERLARTIKRTKFIFIKTPRILRGLDRLIYLAVKQLLRKSKSMSYRYILQRLHYIAKVSRYLQQNNYGKVILENNPTLFLVLKRHHNAQKYAGRYYYHLHNEITHDYGCRPIMAHCQKVIGVSRYIDRQFQAFLNDFPTKRLDVLRNCIDTERFGSADSRLKAEALRWKYHIADDEKVILFTGRLSREKGIRPLLQAYRQIKLAKTKLVIVGGAFYASDVVSDDEKAFQALVEPIKQRIVRTGFIHYADMPAVYSMADIAVLPSMWDDPAPLTVIESMASGLPLVTTLSGGIPEYADPACAVLLPRDRQFVDRLARTLTQLLTDDLQRKRMALAGKQMAKHLNIDRYYRDFVAKLTDQKEGKQDEGRDHYRRDFAGSGRPGRRS